MPVDARCARYDEREADRRSHNGMSRRDGQFEERRKQHPCTTTCMKDVDYEVFRYKQNEK